MASAAKRKAVTLATGGDQRAARVPSRRKQPTSAQRSAKRLQQHAQNIASGLAAGAAAVGAAHAAPRAAAAKPVAKGRNGTKRATGKSRAR
jgi:hypothetical protein